MGRIVLVADADSGTPAKTARDELETLVRKDVKSGGGPLAFSTGLADALFPSTKQRVLRLLFGQPERSFYAKELIGLMRSGSGAVQCELATLTASGLVTVKTIGNQKHYQANPASPIFAELQAIVRKAIGLAESIRNALTCVASRIEAAFVYGSIAKGTDTARSDIDLMLLSDTLSYGGIFAALEGTNDVPGRPVNPTILTRSDFVKRIAAHESFLTRVLEQPKIWIIGGNHDLPTGKSQRTGQTVKDRAA